MPGIAQGFIADSVDVQKLQSSRDAAREGQTGISQKNLAAMIGRVRIALAASPPAQAIWAEAVSRADGNSAKSPRVVRMTLACVPTNGIACACIRSSANQLARISHASVMEMPAALTFWAPESGVPMKWNSRRPHLRCLHRRRGRRLRCATRQQDRRPQRRNENRAILHR